MRLIEIESGDILQLVSQSTQVNISNLHPFYSYSCSVAAVTIGVGPFSDYIPAQTDEYGRLNTFNDHYYYALNVQGQVIPLLM